MSTISLLRRIGDRLVAHYSPTLEPLDASASTIWPTVPEEIDPPRWRFDRALAQADPAEAQAQPSPGRNGDRIGILHA
jgi:hypothetical protein